MAERVIEAFRALTGSAPVAVGRAPGRVNLIGEHTDYNAGLALPVALQHATYAAVGLREDGLLRMVSAQTDDATEVALADLAPGAVDGWAAYVAGVVWALQKGGVAVPGLDVYVDSTVPVGAGLSSSAALECSVGVAMVQLLGFELDDARRERLVPVCVLAETEMAGAPTGGMDQTISLQAQAGHALLIDFESGRTDQIPLPLEDAELAILVVDTRVEHALVDGGYAERREDCETAARELGLPSLRQSSAEMINQLGDDRIRARARHVVTENIRVEAAVLAIKDRDWERLGELFLASHASLRDDYEVSVVELDTVVEAAVGAGALGARMTGGGFGGSAVILVSDALVGDVGAAVLAAFAEADFIEPTILRVVPSEGANVVVLDGDEGDEADVE